MHQVTPKFTTCNNSKGDRNVSISINVASAELPKVAGELSENELAEVKADIEGVEKWLSKYNESIVKLLHLI